MDTDLAGLGQRLRGIREAMEVSVEELATELDIDPQQYRIYESTGADVPISVLYHVAQKFKVDLVEILTGKNEYLNTYHVVRQGQGMQVDRYPGYQFEDLAYRFIKKIMQPLLVTLDPSDEPAALVTHPGQEFNMVIEGSLSLTFGDEEIVLNEGDSIYFNPEHPHGQKCIGDRKTVFLTVIAE